ncbi:helix-turn-helix domain-containing protein [Holdemania filiformis]|uniref:helix-turn-helix domain-containing protein n=1 Tax=Holdemania filiformis TaxID=61171 RepID=UPI003C6CD592
MSIEKLKQFRVNCGFKQNQMAQEIGISASYYYKVESGYQNPSYEFLKKFKERFPESDINELFF